MQGLPDGVAELGIRRWFEPRVASSTTCAFGQAIPRVVRLAEFLSSLEGSYTSIRRTSTLAPPGLPSSTTSETVSALPFESLLSTTIFTSALSGASVSPLGQRKRLPTRCCQLDFHFNQHQGGRFDMPLTCVFKCFSQKNGGKKQGRLHTG